MHILYMALLVGSFVCCSVLALLFAMRGGDGGVVERVDSWFMDIEEKSGPKRGCRNPNSGPSHMMQRKLDLLLLNAGLPLKAGEALTIWAGLVLALSTLLAFLRGVLGAAYGALLASLVPLVILFVRRRQRLVRFEKQIPGFLELLSSGLRAGFSFLQSLQNAADQVEEPMRGTLQTIVAELCVGLDLNVVLQRWLDRVESVDLEMAVSAILIQREVGGNLAEILDNIARLMRDRQDAALQMRALTSQGKMEGIVISLLPVILAVVINFLNPGYMNPLFHTAVGRRLLFTAIAMGIVGILLIQRIVKLRY